MKYEKTQTVKKVWNRALILTACVCCFVIGNNYGISSMWDEAIINEAAQYNSKTGFLEWIKPEAMESLVAKDLGKELDRQQKDFEKKEIDRCEKLGKKAAKDAACIMYFK